MELVFHVKVNASPQHWQLEQLCLIGKAFDAVVMAVGEDTFTSSRIVGRDGTLEEVAVELAEGKF